jgi:hypothetical protein
MEWGIGMDIAAMAIGMHAAQFQMAKDVAVVKKVMDSSEEQATQLIQMMAPPTPSFGHRMDIRA